MAVTQSEDNFILTLQNKTNMHLCKIS